MPSRPSLAWWNIQPFFKLESLTPSGNENSVLHVSLMLLAIASLVHYPIGFCSLLTIRLRTNNLILALQGVSVLLLTSGMQCYSPWNLSPSIPIAWCFRIFIRWKLPTETFGSSTISNGYFWWYPIHIFCSYLPVSWLYADRNFFGKQDVWVVLDAVVRLSISFADPTFDDEAALGSDGVE